MPMNPDKPASTEIPSRIDAQPAAERYADIAKNIRFDEKNPPKPSAILAPVAGNVFNREDEPTLAGKVVISLIYDKLIERPDAVKRAPMEVIAAGKKALGDFEQIVGVVNRNAKKYGQKEFFLGVTRPRGVTGFHLNGEGGHVTRAHLFHFSKSTAEWKDHTASQVRAYLTFDAKEADMMQDHFTNLCVLLYREGVDFTAKAASPAGTEARTDNAIFYVAEYDQEKAAKIIREFMRLNDLGKGTVMAAEPDAEQEGLSWAREPSAAEERYWQDVSGATTAASYNVVVASKIVPEVLGRLAEAHRKNGNEDAAETFVREARRVTERRKDLDDGKGL